VLCPRSDDDDLRVIKRLAVTAAAAANSNCIRRPGRDQASPPFIIQPKGRRITREKKNLSLKHTASRSICIITKVL
jgi:hypothetical protein